MQLSTKRYHSLIERDGIRSVRSSVVQVMSTRVAGRVDVDLALDLHLADLEQLLIRRPDEDFVFAGRVGILLLFLFLDLFIPFVAGAGFFLSSIAVAVAVGGGGGLGF